MVGSYEVEFQVSDLDEESDSKTVKLVVNNVNDAPLPLISSPLYKQKFNTTTIINFDGANSTDDDLVHGDILSYRWDSNISGELSTEPKFSTNLTDVGWHRITLTVIDVSFEETEKYIDIQILPSTIPSENDEDKDGDEGKLPDETKSSDKTGENEISASMMGSIIVIIIILILILTFLWHRKKAKDNAKSDEEPDRTVVLGAIPDQAWSPVPVPGSVGTTLPIQWPTNAFNATRTTAIPATTTTTITTTTIITTTTCPTAAISTTAAGADSDRRDPSTHR